MSSYYITKIIQDSYGFLWIGTQDGLNRYDGKEFRIFNGHSEEKYKIGSAYISDLVEDKKRNILWVATSYGDISGIDLSTLTVKKRIVTDPSGKRLSENWIRSVSVQDDILWIGLSHGIYAYNIESSSFLNLATSNSFNISLSELNVARIFSSKPGQVIFFCDDLGIVNFNSRDLKIESFFSAEKLNANSSNSKFRFWDFSYNNSKLYVAGSWGMRVFDFINGQMELSNELKSDPLIYSTETFSCALDNNTLWLSTSDNFYSIDLITYKRYSYHERKKDTDDWFKFVYQIFCNNNNGMIWIGTQEGFGKFDTKPAIFNAYFKSNFSDTKIKHAYSLFPVSDSVVYSGDENGIYYINTKTGLIEKIDTAATNLMIIQSATKEIFTSGKNGLRLILNKKTLPAFTKHPELSGLQRDLLNSGIPYNDSLIIFSSVQQKGLYVWNSKSQKLTIYHKDSVKHEIKNLSVINNLYKNKDGTLLVITDQSIMKFDPLTGKCKTYDIYLNKVKLSNFMDICETQETYWIATYGNGLVETDKNFILRRAITTRDSLCNDAVYKVFLASDSLIFATTNNGLSVINLVNHKIKNYFQADGLHSNSFEQFCGVQSFGKIYTGGVNGFTIIDPKYFSTNTTVPILYISNIQIKTKSGFIDTSDLLLKSIDIPSDVLQTTISYSALNYSNPERTTISYKIKEQNSDWINIGNNNFLPLIGLSPGTYHLQVQAFNEDGVPSEIKELALIFLPKWYQTWWFKFLLVLLTMGIAYSIYRIRISQLKKEQQIRSKLASDLHDDLGSTMNSVKVYANLAIMDKQEKYLFKIKESTQEAITGIRDIIWVLDDSKDSIEHLLARVSVFASPLCEANGMEYKQEISDEARGYKLGQEERRNLYMMLKESINNAIKYAEAKKAEIDISLKKGKPVIQIKDDGKGFDVMATSEGSGLKNMNRRAKEIKYHIRIESVPGNGTAISLQKI